MNLREVQVDLPSATMLDPTNKDAAGTLAPKAAYTMYLIGVAAPLTAARVHDAWIDPSTPAVAAVIPANDGVVVLVCAVVPKVLVQRPVQA
jgi:hypothetical protein